MSARGRYQLRLELLESRLQPGSILTGIPELSSPDIELPGSDINPEADPAVFPHRRPLEHEVAPHLPSMAAPAITSPSYRLAIPQALGRGAEEPPISRPLHPEAMDLGNQLLPPAAPRPTLDPVPAATDHPRPLTAFPAIHQSLAMPPTVNYLPVHLNPVQPKVTFAHLPPRPGSQGGPYVSYAPATNPDGPNEGHAVAATSDGTAFVTGWTVDANGQQDLFVERTTLAGDVTSAILAAPDGSSWSGQGIVLTGSSTAGTVYVVGNAVDPATGATSILAARLNTADLTVNATITLSGMNGDVTGQALSRDSHGNLVLTGQTAHATGGQDVALFRLDADLMHVLNSISLHLPGPGNAGGNAVALDAADDIFIGGSLDTSATNTVSFYLKLQADLTLAWGYTWNNPADGRNGAANGLVVSGGFLYMTGFFAGNSGTSESRDLLLAKVYTSDGTVYPDGYSQRWEVGTIDQSTGDFGGHAVAVDARGQAFVAADINGPPDDSGALDINGQLVQFSPDGSQILGSVTYGNQTAGTTTPDRDLGVALQSATPGANVFSTGWTESDVPTAGFPITSNAARSVLATAGHDGWVALAPQPLPAKG